MDKIIIFILISMTMIILTLGITFAKREDLKKKNNQILVVLAVFAFLWCGGYAWLELSETIEMAIIARTIGLIGVNGYISVEAYFAYAQTDYMKKHNKLTASMLIIPGIIVTILLSLPGVVTYVPTEFGYRYLSSFSPIRIIQFVYISIIAIFSTGMAVNWWRKESLKRTKMVILALIISEFLKAVGVIFDTVLPMKGITSIPGSSFTVFFAFIIMRELTSKYGTFYISTGNLSKYIYQHVNSTVLIFDVKGKLELVNDYGRNFFDRDDYEKLSMKDLFELTKEDADKMFDEICFQGKDQNEIEYRLTANKIGAICMTNFSVIRDDFGEVFCVICFVNDITKHFETMNELKLLKENLEQEVKDKSREIEGVSLHSITTIANIIDMRDEFTKGHSYRVAQYCELVASTLGWEKERIQNLKYVALLHNIGMIGIPESVLNKTQSLTEYDFEQIKNHAEIGKDILKDIAMVKGASMGAFYHHERFDGTGYPEGIKGKEIPIAARIIAVADAYDTMNHNRIYRKKLTKSKIITELENGRGTQFDPEILDVFLRLVIEGTLSQISLKINTIDMIENESTRLLHRIMNNMEEQNKLNNEKDYLTNLWSRRGGEQRIVKEIQKRGGCLMMIDIDNFKNINDTYGHLSGDYVLKKVAEILQGYSENSIIMRMGGDEFLFFMKNVHSKEEVKIVVDGIFMSLRGKMEKDNLISKISLSVGICFCTPMSHYQTKVENADRALYHVKQNGKNKYRFYSEEDMY